MAIKGLEYVIKLTDQLSSPLKGVMKSVDNLQARSQKAMKSLAVGAAGLWGVGASLKSALDPAIDFSRAMNEVKATGMSAVGLEKVEKFALNFSSTFGIASNEVVSSVNEIARAIDGLTDNEMIAFAESANILAKATGSNTAQMGSYIATMSNIFQDEMERLGKSDWVKQMAGQATLTANMFKSSGESLSAAFSNLGSTAKNAGVSMAEQFAILGNTQGIMDGAKSGTAYRALIENAINSDKMQKKLGMTFVDKKGLMLPITEIIGKIKKKFGNLGKAELQDKLASAFGVGSSIASLLLDKTEQITEQIDKIGKIKNLDEAYAVSKITTDSWMRLSNILQNIKIAIGGQVLKKIEPFMQKIADLGQSFQNWLETYKNIARWIGYIVGATIGFAAVAASISLVTGAFGFLTVGAIAALAPIRGLLSIISLLAKPLTLIRYAIALTFTGFKSLVSIIWAIINPLKMLRLVFAFAFSPLSMLLLAGIAIYKFRNQLKDLWTGVKQGFGSIGSHLTPLYRAFDIVKSAGQKVMNAIGRIAGLFNANAQSAILFQDVGVAVGQAIGFTFDIVVGIIELIAIQIESVATIFSDVADVIIETWHNVIDDWESKSAWDIFKGLATGVGQIFTTILKGIKDQFINTINWIIKKVNIVSGAIGFEIPTIPDTWLSDNAQPTALTNDTNITGVAQGFANAALATPQTGPIFSLGEQTKPRLTEVSSGYASQKLTNTLTKNQSVDRSIHINSMTVQANDPRAFIQMQRDSQHLAP